MAEPLPVNLAEDNEDVEEDSHDTRDDRDSQEDANEEDIDENYVYFVGYASIDFENTSDENMKMKKLFLMSKNLTVILVFSLLLHVVFWLTSSWRIC